MVGVPAPTTAETSALGEALAREVAAVDERLLELSLVDVEALLAGTEGEQRAALRRAFAADLAQACEAGRACVAELLSTPAETAEPDGHRRRARRLSMAAALERRLANASESLARL